MVEWIGEQGKMVSEISSLNNYSSATNLISRISGSAHQDENLKKYEAFFSIAVSSDALEGVEYL